MEYKPLTQRRHFLRGAQINARNVNANECPCECGAHSHTHTYMSALSVCLCVCVYTQLDYFGAAQLSQELLMPALYLCLLMSLQGLRCVYLPPSLSQSPSLTLSPCLLLGLVVKYILGSLAVWLVVDFLSSSYRYPPFLW